MYFLVIMIYLLALFGKNKNIDEIIGSYTGKIYNFV